ncbi:MAG: glycosyltransferase family 39 protein [Rhodocyclaceae bacterium]|nr:glycosyltransferase family 39 protein [Rhodocyclaceae bacterium]
MKDSPAQVTLGFAPTLPATLAIVAGYALLHAVMRLIASGNLGEDDPASQLAIQTLAAGYRLDVGPLYDWLLWLVQTLTGSRGLATFLAVKYGCLLLIAGMIFSITRRLTGSALWAFIAVESLAAIYQIFWRFHEGFTHRVGAMTITIATLWAVLRLAEQPSHGRYALLAVLFGCGLLSEHSVLVFFLALMLAVLPAPTFRRALFNFRLLLWLPLSLLIASPYLVWLTRDRERLAAFLAELLPTVPPPALSGIAHSLSKALLMPLEVLSPWLLIALFTFPRVLRGLRQPAQDQPALRLIERLLAIELALLVIMNGLVFQLTDYAVHSLLPLLLPAVPWLTARLAATFPAEARIRAYVQILFVFTLIAFSVRAANLFLYEPFCSRCRWGTPYEELASRLRALGFEQGLIVAHDIHTAGNLRRFFPEARVYLDAPPEGLALKTPRAEVWLAGDAPAEEDAHAPVTLALPWRAPFKPEGYRQTLWQARIKPTPPL